MNELENALWAIPDAYDDFVSGIMSYVRIPGNERKADIILNFIATTPTALSSDVVEFVTKKTGFFASTGEKMLAAAIF